MRTTHTGPTTRQVTELTKALRALRAQITGDRDWLERETLGPQGVPHEHFTDGALTQAEAMNVELLERDTRALREVEEALERVEDGVFGLCEECDGWINVARLRALPFARHCITCAE